MAYAQQSNSAAANGAQRDPSIGGALKGRDLISIGIYSALYFVLNFACMLVSGFHPLIWVFMPAFIAVLTGIPFMLMCVKVPKFGGVLIMGLITSLIYFATGSFTPFIVALMLVMCLVAEGIRAATKYLSFKGNAVAFAFFGLGMCGSPLPIWIMRDSFFAQISAQGMPADYVMTLAAVTGDFMLPVMLIATFLCGFIGAAIAKALFKKHFEKAGLV